MHEKKYQTFRDFWPHYLSEHQSPLNRRLHFLGTLLALCSVGAFFATGKKRFLGLAPVLGYFFAWAGHFGIEKNRPATFTYPGKSLRGDFKMFGLMLQGKLKQEMKQIQETQDVT